MRNRGKDDCNVDDMISQNWHNKYNFALPLHD